MRYCPDCGAEIEAGRKYCYRCGKILPQTINEPQFNNQQLHHAIPAKKSNKNVFIIIIGVAVLLICIAGFVNSRNLLKEELEQTNYNIFTPTTTTTLSPEQILAYKNECKEYNYRNVQRSPDEYIGLKAYWFGEVVQVLENDSYRISVNCTKNQFSQSGYVCDDTLYVVNKGKGNFVENDMVKMWGVMNGNQSYTTVLGAKMTIPKFNAQIMECTNCN